MSADPNQIGPNLSMCRNAFWANLIQTAIHPDDLIEPFQWLTQNSRFSSTALAGFAEGVSNASFTSARIVMNTIDHNPDIFGSSEIIFRFIDAKADGLSEDIQNFFLMIVERRLRSNKFGERDLLAEMTVGDPEAQDALLTIESRAAAPRPKP